MWSSFNRASKDIVRTGNVREEVIGMFCDLMIVTSINYAFYIRSVSDSL